ncbi:MAG TPA: hypothetical protein VGK34_04925 [Armatimonadota bacterium]|jgi:hypothetical protein
MKVKELIEQLRQLDSEIDILCYTEDTDLLASGHGFRLLDITGVSTVDGEKMRDKDNFPSLKFGNTPISRQHVLLDITSEF